MVERLRAALGPEAILPIPAHGARFPGAPPRAVVAPADTGQAAAALRLCSEHGWTALPAGGATWLQSVRFTGADVLLSTSRMVGVTEYEPADLAIAVRAGTTLADLDDAVRQYNQFFPVQAPTARGATVGGAVATASAGPLRLGYGTPRDHVLGLRVVTGDGRQLDLGGRVVKNVAGYDLVRLMVGSRGSLGLVTRATLRLRSRPVRDITAVLHGEDPRTLGEAVAATKDTWPVAAELLAPDTARLLLGPRAERGVPGNERWCLVLRWHGNDSFADHVTGHLESIGPYRMLERDTSIRFWTALSDLESDQAAAFQLAGRPAELPRLIDAGRMLASTRINQSDKELDESRTNPRWHLAAHAGSGIVRVWTGASDRRTSGDLTRTISEVQRDLAASGTVRVLVPPVDWVRPNGPADAEEAADRASGGVRVRALMRGIRKAFDPAGIFASETIRRRG